MEDMVNLFLNTGVTVVIIAYFMYRDFRFMDTLQTTLQSLVDTVECLKNHVVGDADTDGKE